MRFRIAAAVVVASLVAGCVTTSPTSSSEQAGEGGLSANPKGSASAASANTNCNDLDVISLIADAHASVPHSIARNFGLKNVSTRIGKTELGPKLDYMAPDARDRFVIREATISKRTDFCGNIASKDSRVEGKFVMEIARSGRKDGWKDVNVTGVDFNFVIAGDNRSAAIINNVPFGLFNVTVCELTSPKFRERWENSECNPSITSTKKVFCGLGSCIDQNREGSVVAVQGYLRDLDAYTEYLYKNNKEKLTSIANLPPDMVKVIDRVSGKTARIKREKTDARTKEFLKSFNIKLAATNQSAPRPITSSGLAASMAGSCKDISKNITIEKKRDAVVSGEVAVEVKYTLYRTYSPYALTEEGDPLYVTRNYVFNSQNGFKVSDTLKYDCVLASGRYHSAGLSLLGAIAGTDKRKTGIETTLTKTKFDFDVEGLR